MPVKLGSKLPTGGHDEARIEIVPLIDIMFFLLASFMLVSLSMVNLKSVKVNLPTAGTATAESAHDLLDVSVDRAGALYLDKRPMRSDQLAAAVFAARRSKPALRVLISGDADARHGDVLHALDLVRSAGVQQVGFEIRSAAETSQGQRP